MNGRTPSMFGHDCKELEKESQGSKSPVGARRLV